MSLFNHRRFMSRFFAVSCLILLLTTVWTFNDKLVYSTKDDHHRAAREIDIDASTSGSPSEMTSTVEIRNLLLSNLKAHIQSLPSNAMDIIKIGHQIQDELATDEVTHPWTTLGLNMTKEVKKHVFRTAYESVTNSTYRNIMLTKKNAIDMDIDTSIMNELPENSLLPSPPYKTCAVVGSSGILSGSKCGADIDSMDFVFRFNLATLAGFETDVGSKTNMTTLNPSMRARYGGLKTDEGALNFSRLLIGQNGFVWAPIQKLNATLNPIKRVNGMNPNLTFIRANLRNFDAHRKFWELFGMKKRPSSGFYFVSVALALCSDVHLYGFWPFDKAPDGSSIPHHYHDQIKLLTKNHDMPIEFKIIIAMHKLGLIHLHVANCSKT